MAPILTPLAAAARRRAAGLSLCGARPRRAPLRDALDQAHLHSSQIRRPAGLPAGNIDPWPWPRAHFPRPLSAIPYRRIPDNFLH